MDAIAGLGLLLALLAIGGVLTALLPGSVTELRPWDRMALAVISCIPFGVATAIMAIWFPR
jgi:hypothetical protein